MSAVSELRTATGGRVEVQLDPPSLGVDLAGGVRLRSAAGAAYPAAPFAIRRGAAWSVPSGSATVSTEQGCLWLRWSDGSMLRVSADADGGVDLRFEAASADATALAFESLPDEHYYGLGERFDRLDQRGHLLELWVTNGASGTETYKPVPFVLSSRGYGLALDTSCRVFCQLAHPSVPATATFTVEAAQLGATLLPGPTPAATLERYTRRVGRPPVPPEWVFLPWKSRDWRVENQHTASEDIDLQRELDLACGVKLIDATWESDSHSLAFDRTKYPEPAELTRRAREAGVELVLWLSPSMTAGGAAYREAAARGLLIRNQRGEPYLHPLGNEPSWQGSAIDFTQPAAVTWWQAGLRRLLELGIRGFKTDFGEQVPVDAVFADGRTGRELHNLYPVLYNRATWEVVREFDGVLLARSAWAGSQSMPGVWAGDQSSDFSPWNGLATAIVAGQSAGLSGFPIWGSDVGGYFGTPSDEVFTRWAQFGAFSPIMEVHGLGVREPWLFSPATLATYRRFANLHARLAPYSRAAALQAELQGLPIMRAMALAFPTDAAAHDPQWQYQYLYGPDLLVAPVYWWGETRQVYLPEGVWIDYFSGRRLTGPLRQRVPAPLDTIPVYVRAGAALPVRVDPWTGSDQALAIDLFPGSGGGFRLPDGTRFDGGAEAGGQLEVELDGPDRPHQLATPFRRIVDLTTHEGQAALLDGRVAWRGRARFTLRLEP